MMAKVIITVEKINPYLANQIAMSFKANLTNILSKMLPDAKLEINTKIEYEDEEKPYHEKAK